MFLWQRVIREFPNIRGPDISISILHSVLYTSIPQLPFKKPQIPFNRDHTALHRGTLGSLGKGPLQEPLIFGSPTIFLTIKIPIFWKPPIWGWVGQWVLGGKSPVCALEGDTDSRISASSWRQPVTRSPCRHMGRCRNYGPFFDP